MISKDLKFIANELKLKVYENHLYGEHQNILLSLYEDKMSITLCVDICMADYPERCADLIAEFCHKHSERFNILNLQISATGLKLEFERNEKTCTNLLVFFDNFTKEFYHYGFNSFEKCTNCALDLNDYAIIAIDGFAHVCDKDCAKKITMPNSKAEKKYLKNSFSGFVGALLFSIVGGYLWFYFSLNEYPVLLSAVTIAVLAHLGYIIFGGKPSIERFFAVTIFPAALAVVANFASFGFLLAEKWQSEGFAVDVIRIVDQISEALLQGGDVATDFWTQNIVAFILIFLIAVLFAKAKGKQPIQKNKHIKLFEGDYNYIENSPQPISPPRA